MKPTATSKTSRMGHPLRQFFGRLASPFLMMMAVVLMIVGQTDNQAVNAVRVMVGDLAAPVLAIAARPVNVVLDHVNDATDLKTLRSENIRLRSENLRLRQWYDVALGLEAENKSLRSLLNVVPEKSQTYISARIVADAGGSFVRSFLVAAGAKDGVKKGQAVMTSQGLIGRVTDVGTRSARVLMITDLNARIPVMIEDTLHRAILAGDNTNFPALLYLPPDSNVSAGARLITSGHGGVLPPGLPVGEIKKVTPNGIRVIPYADFSRLTHVQIIARDVTDLPEGLTVMDVN